MMENPKWPVLNTYDQDHLTRIAMPLGGIGTGSVSLGGRGDLRDWEIMNRPAKGYNGQSLFTLYAKTGEEEAVTRALEGILEPPYEGQSGVRTPYHGLPRFRHCQFLAAYPFAQVLLSDPAVPVDVRLEAFNPLVPANADDSGFPGAVLRFVLTNKTDQPVSATVCGTMTNFIGFDGTNGASRGNVNEFCRDTGLQGLYLRSTGVAPQAEQYGTMALVTTADRVSYKRAWPGESWNGGILHFWDDLQDGKLDDSDAEEGGSPIGSLGAEVEIAPNGQQELTFAICWHFPNRQTWTPGTTSETQGDCCSTGCCASESDPDRVGNYYATQFSDAWDVARKLIDRLEELEDTTLSFVSAFCGSDLPDVVKEAALSNLSTLRTQTCFRTEDGLFYGWEGCNDNSGCCLGSCTHVWNYEQATAFLFGGLSRMLRQVEFLHATNDQGLMSFRVFLPIKRALEQAKAAADGQMGCVMKLYRDWQLSGDDAFLTALWPKAKKTLEFCWIEGGWDADQDGVMEGCQHNTLDVEYYGPNPLMQGWYLGALRAAEEMANYLEDQEFAQRCRNLFETGKKWTDANLFNGEYYEQIVQPPRSRKIADGLAAGMGAKDQDAPDYQVGSGCLVDQLVGQFMAHVCDLGYLLDESNVRRTLDSIMTYNFQSDLFAHFNHMRTFALNDESGLLMCTFPRGNRPRTPVPYFNELMTGFEYSTAVHMLYEGMESEGLACITAIRDRYDGRKRNPFNEAECGNHYARAMASWAAVLALTGFRYSAVTKTMHFAERQGTFPWSNGSAWGTCSIQDHDGQSEVMLDVLYGGLDLDCFVLKGKTSRESKFDSTARLSAGETLHMLL